MTPSIHRSLVLASVGLLIAGAVRADSAPVPPLFRFYKPVPSFTLTDQDGKSFSPELLRGKVWVVHFFYAGCNQCNQSTTKLMTETYEAIRGKGDLAIVSITLYPEVDTAESLALFAKGRYKGPDLAPREDDGKPRQWSFLTGSDEQIEKLVKKDFGVGFGPNPKGGPGAEIEHGWQMFVVDREGNVFGPWNAKDETNFGPLLGRMRGLAAERYVLPAVNATLNALAGFLLVVGWVAIRRRRIGLHKGVMVAALVCSGVFLGCYLFYHFAVLRGQSPRLVGPGAVRFVYLAILLTHTILAVVVAPLAIYVAWLGFKDRLEKHVKLAKWTMPIWLYVSVTGVVVYTMLYQLYPPY